MSRRCPLTGGQRRPPLLPPHAAHDVPDSSTCAGERGRATRPCDRLHACRATHRAHACQRRYLNSRPGSCCSSAPQDRRRAWRRKPVRLRCARRTSGAVSFRVTSGKDELLATGLPLFMVCVLPFRSARGTVSVREGGSGGAGGVEPAVFSWNDMASTASTSIVSCCFDNGKQGRMLGGSILQR